VGWRLLGRWGWPRAAQPGSPLASNPSQCFMGPPGGGGPSQGARSPAGPTSALPLAHGPPHLPIRYQHPPICPPSSSKYPPLPGGPSGPPGPGVSWPSGRPAPHGSGSPLSRPPHCPGTPYHWGPAPRAPSLPRKASPCCPSASPFPSQPLLRGQPRAVPQVPAAPVGSRKWPSCCQLCGPRARGGQAGPGGGLAGVLVGRCQKSGEVHAVLPEGADRWGGERRAWAAWSGRGKVPPGRAAAPGPACTRVTSRKGGAPQELLLPQRQGRRDARPGPRSARPSPPPPASDPSHHKARVKKTAT